MLLSDVTAIPEVYQSVPSVTAYGYSYTCDLTEGALPIFWEEVCRGGKIQQP